MHSAPNDIPKLGGDEVVEIVFSILLDRHPALVAFDDELVTEFPYAGTDQAIPDSVIHDAVEGLVRLGLAHRLDRFVFASHTAVRAKQLGV